MAYGEDGIASFDRINRHHDASLYALELIELSSDDLRCDPLAARKATLASLALACRARLQCAVQDGLRAETSR